MPGRNISTVIRRVSALVGGTSSVDGGVCAKVVAASITHNAIDAETIVFLIEPTIFLLGYKFTYFFRGSYFLRLTTSSKSNERVSCCWLATLGASTKNSSTCAPTDTHLYL